tara:strand:- start:901 stop:2133 length:1233 start_codon:yes stop_codon:yes gene_type:complete
MGASFKEITKAAVKVGGELIKTARANKKNVANTEWPNPNTENKTTETTEDTLGSPLSMPPSETPKTYSVTNANGNEETVTLKSMSEQLKDIRKEKLSIGVFGKERNNFTKEQRKAKRQELNILEDNLRASALEFKTFENTITTLIDSDNFNSKATGVDKQNFLRALLSKGEPLENGNRAIQTFDSKGKMAFIYVDGKGDPIMGRDGKQMVMRQDNAEEFLVPKSAAREVYGAHSDIQRKLGEKGYAYDRTLSDSNLEAQLKTKNDVIDILYHQGTGMEQSVAEALHGVKSLADGTTQLEPSVLSAKVFGELNAENWDTAGGEDGGDGVVNEEDFATPDNYKKLVEYILSGDDIDLTKQVIKNYAASQEQIKHQPGLDKYNAINNPQGNEGNDGGDDILKIINESKEENRT